jgi:hypothetical protein
MPADSTLQLCAPGPTRSLKPCKLLLGSVPDIQHAALCCQHEHLCTLFCHPPVESSPLFVTAPVPP